MTRQKLEHLCQPLTPEVVLENLRNLYDDLASSPGWVTDEELETLNACIELLKAVITEVN